MVFFEEGRLYVDARESVLFFAHTDTARLHCYVARHVLVNDFGARDDQRNAYKFCLCAYDRNKDQIQELARALIESGRLTPDGAVYIAPRSVPKAPAVAAKQAPPPKARPFVAGNVMRLLQAWA